MVGTSPGVGSGSIGSSVAGAVGFVVRARRRRRPLDVGEVRGVEHVGERRRREQRGQVELRLHGQIGVGVGERERPRSARRRAAAATRVADAGALVPSTRMEAMMRGSMPIATRSPGERVELAGRAGRSGPSSSRAGRAR